MAAHNLVDARSSERTAVGGEDSRVGGVRGAERFDQRAQHVGGLAPQRAGAPLVALAVEADERVLSEVEVPDAQVGHLLHARPGVVEEQEQRPVPQSQRTVARQAGE